MTQFVHKDFLLGCRTAVRLYESYAADLPIVDFHCHLEPEFVARNHRYDNIAELWLDIDPYKWRAMRINGVPEHYITGDADPEEKFQAFAETLPRMVGSPLYHWSALELKQFFDIDRLLNGDSAKAIYAECNARISGPGYGTSDILARANVETVVTSDNWESDLRPHISTQQDERIYDMRPSLRADAALRVGTPGYASWLNALEVRSKVSVDSLDALEHALRCIINEFAEAGCLFSDHSLERVDLEPISRAAAREAFKDLRGGRALSPERIKGLQTHVFYFLCSEYARRGWTLQLHLGAHRETSNALMKRAAIAGGYACVGDSVSSVAMSRLFNDLESIDGLPRTIIYPLNVGDFEKLASLSGSFVEEGRWSKVQLGPPWWFNDHYEGIVHQLKVFANYSLLGRFVGMVTDTRSPLSMARFDYFRRIFCHVLGTWVEQGHVPDDADLLETLVKDVCYRNAAEIAGSTTRSRYAKA